MKIKQTEIKIIIIKRNIMKRKKEREEEAMKRLLHSWEKRYEGSVFIKNRS